MERRDCYSYRDEHYCFGLIHKQCDGCKFYKTKEEVEQANIKALEICKKKRITKYNSYLKKSIKRKDDEDGKQIFESGDRSIGYIEKE